MPSFRHFFMLYRDDCSDHDSWVCITRYRHSKLISDGDPLTMNLRYLYLIDFHPVIVLNEVSEDAHVIYPFFSTQYSLPISLTSFFFMMPTRLPEGS